MDGSWTPRWFNRSMFFLRTCRRSVLQPLAIAALFVLIGTHLASIAHAAPSPAQPAGYGVLKLETGTWDADLAYPAANGKIQHLKAVQKNSLIANGAWMLNDLYMDGGKPGAPRYHGHGVWTYNATTQRFEGIWVDGNFASMRHDNGTWDAATKTIYWFGEQPDYKGHTAHDRFEEQFKGNTRIFRMYVISGKTGKQRWCGTLTFTRRPGTDNSHDDDTSALP